MSILRLGAVRREIGTFIDPRRRQRRDRARASGSAWSARTGPARRPCSGSPPASTSPTAARSRASAACASASSSRSPTSTPAFMAAPDLRIAVRAARSTLERMELELRRLEQDHRVTEPAYESLQHEFEVLGGYTLDQRVDETLSGLGFARDEWARPPVAMSGGQQTRAALARLVIADPDLLLLDEPTNHLDLDALEWIEEHLRRRAGSLLVASHDRAFLDATVTRIWELRDRRMTVFRGDYSAYHRQRVERDERAAKDAEGRGGRDRPRAGARPALPEPPQVLARCTSTRPGSTGCRRRRSRRRGPARSSACRRPRWPAHGPSRSGETVVTLDELVVGYPPGRRPDVDETARGAAMSSARYRPAPGSPRRAASGSASSDRTGPARRRSSGRSPATCRRSTAGCASATPSRSATSPSCATRRSRARRSSTRSSARCRSPPARPAATSPGSSSAATTCSRRSASCPAASAPGSSSPCSASRPANLLLLDEPTNHLDIPAREAIEAFLAGHARRRSSSCPTTGACSRRSATGCGSSTTASPSRSTAAIERGGPRSSDGWSPDVAAEVRGAPAPRRDGRRRDEIAADRRRCANDGRDGAGCPVRRSARRPRRVPPRGVAGRGCRRTPTAARRLPSTPS